MQKVCITGMGLVSSLGNMPEELFSELDKGSCNFKFFEEWESYNGLETFVAAPAKEFDDSSLPRNVRRSMSRMSTMAYDATKSALKDAALSVGRNSEENDLFKPNHHRTLVIMGSTSGSPIFLEKYFKKMIENGGPKGQLSTSFFKVMNHSVAANVALALGYSGPLISPSSACSTSSQAVIMGAELIKAGLYDVVIAGGADELHYTSVSVFDVVKASSKNYNKEPLKIPGPFDANRDGLVVSEGAGIVVLESESHVKERGGKVYAEFMGGAYFCDGIHMSQPQAEQMSTTIEMALEKSGVSASQVDYVNAHATGTKVGDLQEALAIKKAFPGQDIPVSSLKGHLGHSLAACGSTELIAMVEMMKNKRMIATRNISSVTDEFSGINILKENVNAEIEYAVSNNFAFGGMNTSFVIKNLM